MSSESKDLSSKICSGNYDVDLGARSSKVFSLTEKSDIFHFIGENKNQTLQCPISCLEDMTKCDYTSYPYSSFPFDIDLSNSKEVDFIEPAICSSPQPSTSDSEKGKVITQFIKSPYIPNGQRFKRFKMLEFRDDVFKLLTCTLPKDLELKDPKQLQSGSENCMTTNQLETHKDPKQLQAGGENCVTTSKLQTHKDPKQLQTGDENCDSNCKVQTSAPVNAEMANVDSNKSAGDIGEKTSENVVNSKDSVPKSAPYQVVQNVQRRHNVKYVHRNGKGLKICQLSFVASNIRKASTRLLRILHYVLFGTYGLCNSAIFLSQTKYNILQFCGFPFEKDSEDIHKKEACLMQLPFPILCEMYKVIFRKAYSNRQEMVSELIDFFLQPVDLSSENYPKQNSLNKSLSVKSENKVQEVLKAAALNGPRPIVKMKKLSDSEIGKFHQESTEDEKPNIYGPKTEGEYFIPAYILRGPGVKLQKLPKVVKNVHKADPRVIRNIHFLLYGRFEDVDACKRNILEFSGFLVCQKSFALERMDILNGMEQAELLEICQVFNLPAKTISKERKIEKIMKFLKKPQRHHLYKERSFKYGQFPHYSKQPMKRSPQYEPNNEETALEYGLSEDRKPSIKRSPRYESDNEDATDKKIPKTELTGPKLRDFPNICFNIECATPSDLTELNDLLFVRPCDESEIHQKILDFTRFTFNTSCIEYHYRKTLMHYMSSCAIRKMAGLLDLPNVDSLPNYKELSDDILNFLMDMKLPDSERHISTQDVHAKFPSAQSESDTKKQDLVSTQQNNIGMQNGNHSFSNATPNVSDDALPLSDLILHPTDEELREIIRAYIKQDLMSLTMGDLIQKVFNKFPTIDLKYRENFIKTEVRQILSKLRSGANKMNTT